MLQQDAFRCVLQEQRPVIPKCQDGLLDCASAQHPVAIGLEREIQKAGRCKQPGTASRIKMQRSDCKQRQQDHACGEDVAQVLHGDQRNGNAQGKDRRGKCGRAPGERQEPGAQQDHRNETATSCERLDITTCIKRHVPRQQRAEARMPARVVEIGGREIG